MPTHVRLFKFKTGKSTGITKIPAFFVNLCRSAVGGGFIQLLDRNGGYPVGVQLGNRDLQMLRGEGLSLDRHLVQLLHDPAAHGNAVGFQFHIEELHEVLQTDGAIDPVEVFSQLLKILLDLVVFIPDLAHQLLQNVLHRDDSQRAAEIIDHDRDVGFLVLKRFQNVPDFGVLIDEQRLRHDLGDGLIGHFPVDVEILLMENANDLINGIPVDKQPGEPGLGEGLCDFLVALVDVNGFQLDAMGQNFRRRQVAELQGVSQKLTLVLINAAVMLHVLHEKKQLFMGHFGVAVRLDEAGNQLFALSEEKIQRRQRPYPQADERRAEHGETLRGVLCNALGCDFTKEQDDESHDHGGDRRADITVKCHEQKRTDGCYGNVYDVVANQDGRDQPVIILGKLKGQRRPLVSVVGENLQPGFIQRRECRFRCAEIGRHGKTDCHCENASNVIHTKLLFLFIYCRTRSYAYTLYRRSGRR